MFLLNKNGGIYLAKRSKIKKQNSLLYDKTVGGHIQADESPEYTLIRECAEELGFPAAVLSEPEFLSAIGETNLNIVGVFKEVETLNHFMSHRLHVNGELYVFPQITTVYLGVFDGPIKFKDGETSGVEIYYPDEILKEIKDNPKKYTEDVKVLIPKYLNEIKEIVKQIKKY